MAQGMNGPAGISSRGCTVIKGCLIENDSVLLEQFDRKLHPCDVFP